MHMKQEVIGTISGLIFALLATSAQATTVYLAPGDADFEGSDPNNPNASDVSDIVGVPGLLSLYKDDAGGSENGSFADNYTTTYDYEPDPEDATITWDGGDSISCPECFLVVKDGSHDPIWYIFDIGNWDGMMDIELTGFWPDQGAISHVEIVGGVIPVPAAVWLFGSGLLGLVGVARRRKNV